MKGEPKEKMAGPAAATPPRCLWITWPITWKKLPTSH